MSEIYIIGVGQIQFGKYPEETVRTLAHQAVSLALLDAGLDKEDIQAAYFANSFWGLFENQHSIRGQVVMRSMGIDKIPVTNVENACAGGSTALHLAYTSVRANLCDVALVVGSEKMSWHNKAEGFLSYASCLDVEHKAQHLRTMRSLANLYNSAPCAEKSSVEIERSVFLDLSATQALWHMKKYGTTHNALAHISSKNHFHGSLNPRAQYQQPMGIDEVLSDIPITAPFTRSMCSPLADGAAAVIVCSKGFFQKLRAPRAAKILASVMGQGSDRDMDGEDIAAWLARDAYAMARVSPQDVDVAELHDSTAFGELFSTESMGFCPPGEGGAFALSGATALGGEIPVNTSGGLESQGHPSGASGLAQIHEIVVQLRGEADQRQVQGAQIGLTDNSGGNIGVEEATKCIHILEKEG